MSCFSQRLLWVGYLIKKPFLSFSAKGCDLKLYSEVECQIFNQLITLKFTVFFRVMSWQRLKDINYGCRNCHHHCCRHHALSSPICSRWKYSHRLCSQFNPFISSVLCSALLSFPFTSSLSSTLSFKIILLSCSV